MNRLTYFVAPLVALLSLAQPAAADPELRVQRDINGDFVIFGNTLAHECQAGGMPAVPDPIVGEIGDCPNDNDFAPDIYWRADEPGAGEALADEATAPEDARSTAMLVLPEDAEVVYARLYWAALSDMASPDGTVRVQRPASGLDTEVTADDGFEVEDQNDADNIWYHSTADVTALVQAQGVGAYRIAGVGSVDIVGLGSENAVAAWAMVVLYEKPGDPSRNLAIFDGLDLITDTIGSAEATLSGFLVPNAGFDAKLGVIAYEGEAQFTGDSLLFNDVTLSNGQNPANNFFNATRTVLGMVQSNQGDLPQLTGGPRSLSNVDLDVIDVTPLVNEGDTAATIEATSTLDTFLLGAFVTSISTFKPEFVSSTKEVIDDNGGAIRPGDELVYRITVRNSGSDTSIDTVLTDALPMGVTFVPDSIEIEAGANMGEKTDAAGDDQASYDEGTRTVTVNVGAGATAMMGGELAIGDVTIVSLRVTVDEDAAGVIENQAVITAEGEQGAPSEDTVTDGNGNGAGQPPTVIVVDGCDVDDDCEDPTPFCDFASSPRLCVECVTSAQCEDDAEPDCNVTTHVCECASGDCSEDSDGDGISDSAEEELGTDPEDADTDDDGVPDGSEIAPADDTDGDGLINALDPDSDNDALFDGTELGLGCGGEDVDVAAGHCIADGDMGATKTNPVAADTDGGGVSDGSEDFDRDGEIDSGETDPTVGHGDDDDEVTDTDGDGLSDDLEDELHSDPDDEDTDDDGVPDGEEANPADDTDGDGLISVLDVDSDNDGLFDGTELGKNCMAAATDADAGHCRPDNDGGATKTSPLVADTDGGGMSDGSEDSNLNGVVDAGETNPVAGQGADDATRGDTDGDGLSDALEMELGTGVDDADSDDDGVPDGQEPNPSDDHDGDGNINARDADSDDDGLFDGTELGKDCSDPAIDEAAMTCKADGDGGDTTTSAINDDTDFGGKKDGDEDADKDGVFDDGETDPNDARDDNVGQTCTTDSDCGADDSGVICDDGTCDFGCRGTGGNGCPDGETCSSTTMEPGTCGDTMEPMAGSGGMGGSDGGAGVDGGAGEDGGAGSGGMGGASGASGASGSGFPTLGGGGCDCRVSSGPSRTTDALLICSALALLWLRRRN